VFMSPLGKLWITKVGPFSMDVILIFEIAFQCERHEVQHAQHDSLVHSLVSSMPLLVPW